MVGRVNTKRIIYPTPREMLDTPLTIVLAPTSSTELYFSLYPEVPVIVKIVISKIKPSVRAVKNLLRSDIPKLANIGLPK